DHGDVAELVREGVPSPRPSGVGGGGIQCGPDRPEGDRGGGAEGDPGRPAARGHGGDRDRSPQRGLDRRGPAAGARAGGGGGSPARVLRGAGVSAALREAQEALGASFGEVGGAVVARRYADGPEEYRAVREAVG